MLLFLQGCSIRCEGCVNRHLWDFGRGDDATTDEIIAVCKENQVEGITLHGGEPLDQADGLYPIVKELKDSGFTIILFTGYNKKELTLNQRKIWDLSDMIICGKFDLNKRNIYLQFRGSTNQRIIRRKGKYKHYQVKNGKTVATLTVGDDGILQIKGFYTEDVDTLCNL